MWRSYQKSHIELNKAIRIKDIVFSADKSSSALYQRSSKTDLYHKGVHISIFANKKLCPVYSMYKFVQMRISQGASMSDRLFVDFNGVVLTRHQFINYLHHLFRGPSFRIGAATSAASAGIEDHLIQTFLQPAGLPPGCATVTFQKCMLYNLPGSPWVVPHFIVG